MQCAEEAEAGVDNFFSMEPLMGWDTSRAFSFATRPLVIEHVNKLITSLVMCMTC